MRVLAWSLLAVVLVGCPAPPPAAPPRPEPTFPDGWWVETADEINADDVGTGARFSAAGAIIVTKAGSVQRTEARLVPAGPREWRFEMDGDAGTVRQLASGALVVETRGKRVTFRRATGEEARRLEAIAK